MKADDLTLEELRKLFASYDEGFQTEILTTAVSYRERLLKRAKPKS